MCLEAVKQEVGDALEIEWRSFLLRPYPEPKDLERFRRYTESWLRPAAQADAGEFRVWATDEAPPSHSVPPNVAVKAAARQGAFERYHMALMRAYFASNRNVTDPATILAVAAECDLDLPRFERDLADPALVEAVVGDHNEAVAAGVTGVPCVLVEGSFPLPGAQERAVYLRVIEKILEKKQQLSS